MKLNILLAEDDADDVDIFIEAAQRANLSVSVHPVKYCREIFEAETQEFFPHAIILDNSLTDKTAIDCIVDIKAHEKLRNLPTYVLSGHISPKIKKQCEELGVTDCIEKPATLSELSQVITNIYNHCFGGKEQ